MYSSNVVGNDFDSNSDPNSDSDSDSDSNSNSDSDSDSDYKSVIVVSAALPFAAFRSIPS